jgi:beta-fructofuranosidase
MFGLSLFGVGEADSSPWLSVEYDSAQPNQIRLDEKTAPIQPDKAGELELHFYIDGSVIEAFVNNQAAYTKRFYYSGSSAPQLSLKIIGKTTCLSGLSMWQLSPISPNRLTT